MLNMRYFGQMARCTSLVHPPFLGLAGEAAQGAVHAVMAGSRTCVLHCCDATSSPEAGTTAACLSLVGEPAQRALHDGDPQRPDV